MATMKSDFTMAIEDGEADELFRSTVAAALGGRQQRTAALPSFFATNGFRPEPYVDYDPDHMSQDDYEYITGTGLYSDGIKPGAPKE